MNDLQEILDSHPMDDTRPDLPALIRDGQRLQRRRRGLVGAAGLATVLAVVGGAAAIGHSRTPADPGFAHTAPGPKATTKTPQHRQPSPQATEPSSSSGCPVADAIFICEKPPAEHREPVGDVVPIGHQSGDSSEALYAVREQGFDMASGDATMITSVRAGLLEHGDLFGNDIGLQPGSGPALPIQMAGGTQAGRYAIAGVVENGTYDSITWTDANGGTHPVTGLSTAIVSGWTVFWLYGTDGQGPAYDFDKVVIHAGATSCALSRCAVQGSY